MARSVFRSALVTALVILVWSAAEARAQAHLQLIGGMTQAAERQPFFGAGIGVRFGALEIDAEGGYMKDLLPKGVLDSLNDLQRERNLPVQAIASVPALYGLAGLRLIPGAGPIRPFISAGAGVARLAPRFDVEVAGISLGDVFGLTSVDARLEPAGAVGAGLRIDGGAVHVEGGYRFLVVGSDFRPLGVGSGRVVMRVHTAYAAVGARF